MAELILTEEEKASTWAGLSEETLGKIMKKTIFAFEASHDIEEDKDPWYIKLGLIVWAGKCIDQNATEASARLEGITRGDTYLGDWEIALRRVDDGQRLPPAPPKSEEGHRHYEFTIQADQLTAGKRISSAWALFVAGLRCLFLGRMRIVVSKNMRLTGVGTSRGPE